MLVQRHNRGVDTCSWWLIVHAVLIIASLFCIEAMAANSNALHGVVRVESEEGVARPPSAELVVFVDGFEAVSLPEVKEAEITISQKNRVFTPRVLPITVGTSVRFPNDDTIYHNVFSLSETKPFDLGIYPTGGLEVVTFDRPGLVKVFCNLHPNMASNVLVLNNGFFAKTDDAGRYEISGIPDGEFFVRVWGENVRSIDRQIELTGGQSFEANFVVDAVRRVVRHKNKFGMPYREKY